MKKTLSVLAAVAALLAAPVAVQAKDKLTPQQRLDKMLEGRVAGKPVTCISLSDSHDMVVLNHLAIVYKAGSVIYVNKTSNPQSLDSDDIQVSTITGSGLCRLDMIHMHERTMGTWRGTLSLEDFVPYRKVKN
jgi:hypothetical protein